MPFGSVLTTGLAAGGGTESSLSEPLTQSGSDTGVAWVGAKDSRPPNPLADTGFPEAWGVRTARIA